MKSSDTGSRAKISNLESILDKAEERASAPGREILITSRSMILDGEVVIGSCWDYINTVYTRAGFSPRDRMTVWKSKKKGPFVDLKTVEPGDWLYFINHSYREVDHSGVFVAWIDQRKKSAVIMSYQGGRKKTPASYKIYNLKNTYYLIRGK